MTGIKVMRRCVVCPEPSGTKSAIRIGDDPTGRPLFACSRRCYRRWKKANAKEKRAVLRALLKEEERARIRSYAEKKEGAMAPELVETPPSSAKEEAGSEERKEGTEPRLSSEEKQRIVEAVERTAVDFPPGRTERLFSAPDPARHRSHFTRSETEYVRAAIRVVEQEIARGEVDERDKTARALSVMNRTNAELFRTRTAMAWGEKVRVERKKVRSGLTYREAKSEEILQKLPPVRIEFRLGDVRGDAIASMISVLEADGRTEALAYLAEFADRYLPKENAANRLRRAVASFAVLDEKARERALSELLYEVFSVVSKPKEEVERDLASRKK